MGKNKKKIELPDFDIIIRDKDDKSWFEVKLEEIDAEEIEKMIKLNQEAFGKGELY